MAIKFGMTVADMIMQLTKGFIKATGRKPEALEKIKIQQEAVQRFKDMNKVVDMEGKTIDTSKGIMGGKEMKAMGGRIGYKLGSIDKARRAFLKTAAGVGGGIAALKTGLLGLSKKAPEAVEKVTENFSTTLSEAPNYFFDLVAKIKSFGKQSKVGPSERVNEYSYIGKNGDQYTLTEDIATGDAQIVKDKMGVGSYGDKTFDTINDRTVMEYKAPKQDVDVETGTGTREAAEYEEYKVEFDVDGTEAGADAIDEMVQKEIIEEAVGQAPSIKKADGGRIGYKNGLGVLSLGDRGFIKKPKKRVIVIDGVEYEIPLDKGFNRIPEPNPDAVPPVPMPTYPKNKKAGGGIARMLGE